MILVLIITLLITIFLLGSTIDKIMVDNIRLQITNSIFDSISENQRLNQLQDTQERQSIIDKQISIQIKSLGLDEPWYSPKKITNSLIQIIT